MNKLLQPEVITGSVNLLKLLVEKTDGTYKSWEQHAIDNVLTDHKRLQELEARLIEKGIVV